MNNIITKEPNKLKDIFLSYYEKPISNNDYSEMKNNLFGFVHLLLEIEANNQNK